MSAGTLARYLKAIRLKYFEPKRSLLEDNVIVKDPLDIFHYWLDDAKKDEDVQEPHAACLATVSKDGFPSNRFVILREITSNGFIFYTNYGSRKALDIASNPHVAMSFFWAPLQRSVRIEGVAERIPREQSLEFFYRRPRVTQIATLASDQSSKIASRNFMYKFEAGIKATLGPTAEVPMPNWGGFTIKPHLMEFWQGQEDLMPDRLRFRRGADVKAEDVDGNLVHKGSNGWIYERLAP